MEEAFVQESIGSKSCLEPEIDEARKTNHLYEDIAKRTGGDIYIGVVGPVRTGKSTFVKKFMQEVVLPRMDGSYKKERATDELPQSGAGKTVTTTEPKFVPEEAVNIPLSEGSMRLRLVDCVGYMVPSAIGYLENDRPRMVRTPWFSNEIPFDEAAEYGTKKVITDHATIGIAITTDGSISDIPRKDYEKPEEAVISELKKLGKPFVLLLNSVHPEEKSTKELAAELEEKYAIPVLPLSCAALTEGDFLAILERLLATFPLREIALKLPAWVTAPEAGGRVKETLYTALLDWARDLHLVSDLKKKEELKNRCALIARLGDCKVDYGSGSANLEIFLDDRLFYELLSEQTGLSLQGEGDLLKCMVQMAEICRKYEKVRPALEQVEATGYGIVLPGIEELTLEEPEIMRQNGRYGVRLKAGAPSIHMMRAEITTEISPIVGSERQSEELVDYLMAGFKEDPLSIWQSNIFGTSLHELVNEGLHNKLYRMPSDARMKLQETIERIINEGCGGLICIIL